MAFLASDGFAVITLPTGHVIPRNGLLNCTNETIDANWTVLCGPILAGQIMMGRDPEPEAQPVAPVALAEPIPEPAPEPVDDKPKPKK